MSEEKKKGFAGFLDCFSYVDHSDCLGNETHKAVVDLKDLLVWMNERDKNIASFTKQSGRASSWIEMLRALRVDVKWFYGEEEKEGKK